MSSLTAYNSGRLQAGHPPGVQQERDDHPDQQELGAVLQSKPCGPPLETRKRIGDHDHGEAPCSAGEIRMIYPLRRVSPFSPIPISGKSPNSATSKRASEGSEALPSLARRVRMSFFGARVIEAGSKGGTRAARSFTASASSARLAHGVVPASRGPSYLSTGHWQRNFAP